jgi:hypothetical protein
MNFDTAYHFLADVSGYSVVVPIAATIVFFGRQVLVTKILLGYLICSLITEKAFDYVEAQRLSPIVLESAFCLTEFLLISTIYYLRIFRSSEYNWAFILILCIELVLFSIELIVPGMNFYKPTYSMVLVIFALYTFLTRKLSPPGSGKITDNYFFWINSGVFYFFGTTFVIFFYDDFIMSRKGDLSKIAWIPLLLNNMIYYALLTCAACKVKRA